MKLGRYVLLFLIFLFFSYQLNRVSLDRDVVVSEGDSYGIFFDSMSWRDALTTKLYLKSHFQKTPPVYPGVYRFDKPMSYQEFLETVSVPPLPVMVKVTLLEGRSSWDYDSLLAKKGYASLLAYRTYVTSPDAIEFWRQQYPFIASGIPTLEGFLYPDTYNIDANKGDVIQQLVGLQLKNFREKVWLPYVQLFESLNTRLDADHLGFKLSTYSIIKLASIIENEEKNKNNKQTIAGLFLNRIGNAMQLGADVTLCYGLSITYDLCTPSFIVEHLYDKQNPYNTRQQTGLPPTPISNPTVESILAVLHYTKTDYLYYLHDASGKIYYASTLQEHNANKQQHLR